MVFIYSIKFQLEIALLGMIESGGHYIVDLFIVVIFIAGLPTHVKIDLYWLLSLKTYFFLKIFLCLILTFSQTLNSLVALRNVLYKSVMERELFIILKSKQNKTVSYIF